jgi:hypothetical protein
MVKFKPENELDRKTRRKYTTKRRDAELRGIPFNLSYEEFKDLLKDAGITYKDIGSFKGQYCLCRKGDLGGYVVGNCSYKLTEENREEALRSVVLNGKSFGSNGINNGKSKGLVKTPWGIFSSISAAECSPKSFIKSAQISRNIRKGVKGFYYISKKFIILLEKA